MPYSSGQVAQHNHSSAAQGGSALTPATLDALTALQLGSADAESVGIGQTWQNVGGSRALNTQYQNTTGRPIMVSVCCTRGNVSSRATLQVSADAVTWIVADYFGSNMTSTGATDYATGNAVVPVDWYYKCTIDGGQGLTYWSELR